MFILNIIILQEPVSAYNPFVGLPGQIGTPGHQQGEGGSQDGGLGRLNPPYHPGGAGATSGNMMYHTPLSKTLSRNGTRLKNPSIFGL